MALESIATLRWDLQNLQNLSITSNSALASIDLANLPKMSTLYIYNNDAMKSLAQANLPRWSRSPSMTTTR
jgi:Leucine-rich repeat (LRR) protein